MQLFFPQMTQIKPQMKSDQTIDPLIWISSALGSASSAGHSDGVYTVGGGEEQADPSPWV